ncbi:MAG: class I tRNA ligase family protein, partial [Clostridia bacterium]|nr:class I tRNA ligase family protein [Clostridia bacterium]
LDIIDQYGADTLRVYVLFMGDYGSAAPWSMTSVRGCKKFLERVASLTDMITGTSDKKVVKSLHATVKKVTSDIESMKFNTAIAQMMTFVNEVYACGGIAKDDLFTFITVLNPFAPHLTEEMHEVLGGKGLLSLAAWPEYDESMLAEDTVEIAVQVCGRLRATIELPRDCSKEDAARIIAESGKIAAFTEGKTFVKDIYVPNRIYNIIIK